MKNVLASYLDTGQISALDIINIEQQALPDAFNFIRSVPVMVMADLPFVGNYSHDEINDWLRLVGHHFTENYLQKNLIDGNLHFLISLLSRRTDLLASIIPLLKNDETGMQVRIGITAIVESFTKTAALHELVPAFKQLTTHHNINTATDALYYLSLAYDSDSKDKTLHDFISRFLQHENAECRSIAEDFLDEYPSS